jgi:outer membrane biosynthesis protein TonB
VEAPAQADDTGDAVAMAESIQQSVRNQKGQLRFCYEKRLRDNPKLKGIVLVAFDVAEGGVDQVSVLSNSTGDAVLAKCFSSQINGWRFSPDVELAVEFPFYLNASRSL